MLLSKIVKFLDEIYGINSLEVPDISNVKRVKSIDKIILKSMYPAFLKTYNGLCFYNGSEIREIYFSCFLSNFSVEYLKKINASDALLITHHLFDFDAGEPGEWNAKGSEFIHFEFYEWLKKNKISVYVLHMPLDMNANTFNTHKALCKNLNLTPVRDLLCYDKYQMGYIAKVNDNIYINVEKNFKKSIYLGMHLPPAKELIGKTVSVIAGMVSSVSMMNDIVQSGSKLCICGDLLIRSNTNRMKKMKQAIKDCNFPFLCLSHQWSEEPVLIELRDVMQMEFPEIKSYFILGEDRWK